MPSLDFEAEKVAFNEYYNDNTNASGRRLRPS